MFLIMHSFISAHMISPHLTKWPPEVKQKEALKGHLRATGQNSR